MNSLRNKKSKIRLNVAVYAILFLLATAFFLASWNKEIGSTWIGLLNGLSVELLGAVVLFIIAQYFFIWNEDLEARNERLDQFLTRNEQDSYSSVFVIDKDSKSNDKFYDYLNDRISKAKYDIYVSGEGFDSVGSEPLADDYTQATKAALKNKVSIVRLQTSSKISVYWARHLRELLKNECFTLYLTDSSWSRGSLCSIDYVDQINNITEYMLSVSRSSGMNESNIAGLAVFVRNNHDLATDVMQMIKTRCKDKNLSTCITSENFDNYLTVK